MIWIVVIDLDLESSVNPTFLTPFLYLLTWDIAYNRCILGDSDL